MSNQQTVTWADRVQDLQAAGYSLPDISAQTGLSRTALSDIGRGRTAEPKGMQAVKLYNLHAGIQWSNTKRRGNGKTASRRK